MFTADDYLEMARECVASAEQTEDPKRQQALIEAAKLYTQTAVLMQGATVPTPEKPQAA